jgi:hypothetical protein
MIERVTPVHLDDPPRGKDCRGKARINLGKPTSACQNRVHIALSHHALSYDTVNAVSFSPNSRKWQSLAALDAPSFERALLTLTEMPRFGAPRSMRRADMCPVDDRPVQRRARTQGGVIVRNRFTPIATALAIGLLGVHDALACTRVLWQSPDNQVLVGRTQDWTEKAGHAFRVFPRGM